MASKMEYSRTPEPEQDSPSVRLNSMDSDAVHKVAAKKWKKSNYSYIPTKNQGWHARSSKGITKAARIWKKEAPWEDRKDRSADPAICPWCEKKTTVRKYYQHLSKYHPNAYVECPKCKKEFRAGKLWEHLNYKHGVSILGEKSELKRRPTS